MIIKVSQKIFMANDEKKLPAEMRLIRAISLFHICQRFTLKNREVYIADDVYFNYTSGNYYCANLECGQVLEFKEVSSDGKGTGWEGNA